MAYTVPPKDNPVRRNRRNYSDLVLDRRDGSLIGPELPDDRQWCKKTREWYDMWRSHEIAPLLENSDWDELQSVALLHNKLWSEDLSAAGASALRAEIRKTVAGYGATLSDRLNRRIVFNDRPELIPNQEKFFPMTSSNTAGVDYREMFIDERFVD
ncbi:hypothetical protein ACFQZ8_00920 [Micromonospora azadirachtae]|uniref:Uncharacterized protein n=1 Tax=Micromonospora azadirachtae TaxID=1970735 RepID=A0ABW2ZV11_9ACTN